MVQYFCKVVEMKSWFYFFPYFLIRALRIWNQMMLMLTQFLMNSFHIFRGFDRYPWRFIDLSFNTIKILIFLLSSGFTFLILSVYPFLWSFTIKPCVCSGIYLFFCWNKFFPLIKKNLVFIQTTWKVSFASKRWNIFTAKIRHHLSSIIKDSN